MQGAAPGAALVVEGAQHLLQLKAEQAAAFGDKVSELAAVGGWMPVPNTVQSTLQQPPANSSAAAEGATTSGIALTEAHLLFTCRAASS
jgi:hypothetical protein